MEHRHGVRLGPGVREKQQQLEHPLQRARLEGWFLLEISWRLLETRIIRWWVGWWRRRSSVVLKPAGMPAITSP